MGHDCWRERARIRCNCVRVTNLVTHVNSTIIQLLAWLPTIEPPFPCLFYSFIYQPCAKLPLRSIPSTVYLFLVFTTITLHDLPLHTWLTRPIVAKFLAKVILMTTSKGLATNIVADRR